MLIHCGAEVSEGSGSPVRIALNGVRAVFHRRTRRRKRIEGRTGKSVNVYVIDC
jgi:hypothetical protein